MLKTGKSRRLPEQYDYMNKFFHGKVPSHPPQIKLLAEGHLNYRDLYDVVNVKITKKKVGYKKNTSPSASKLKLKDVLTNSSSCSYYSGEDILHLDLEKKNKTGPTLITGRNLHAMAIRGAREYKKALAFSTHRWDSGLMCPKRSGETIDDVIEYVRRSMYREKMKEKGKHKDGSEDDSDEDNDDNNESVSVAAPSSSHGANAKGSTSPAASTSDNNTSKDKHISSDYESNSEESSVEKEDEIPSDYVFPSFYVFVLHGPFVPTADQLDINIIESKDKKKGEGTRSQQRKAEAREKANDAKGDSTSTRGFTTDQRIDIENLGLRKESMIDRKNEVAMVALSLEESAMTKMIAAAEQRAMQRCP